MFRCGRSISPSHGISVATMSVVFVMIMMSLLQSNRSSIGSVLAFHHQKSLPVRRHCSFTTKQLFTGRTNTRLCAGRRARTLVLEKVEEEVMIEQPADESEACQPDSLRSSSSSGTTALISAATLAATAVGFPAQNALAIDKAVMSSGPLDPTTFVPVCPASDGFYRLLQGTTEAVVGPESFVQYGPLIAGGLLRVRLELCVVESFVNEAVIPFVQKNGLSWILPLHETVETFLAGVIFALATTFILIGSTKILTVIVTYTDYLLGLPSRIFGGFVFDRASGKPVTLDVGFGPLKTRVIGPPEKEGSDGETDELDFSKLGIAQTITVIISGAIRAFGIAIGFVRDALDSLDFFVGKYLFFWASFYILIKFVHYKIFPDFP